VHHFLNSNQLFKSIMKDYDSYYYRCQNPSYGSDHYINYGLHKEKLRQYYSRRRKISKILRKEQGLTEHAFNQLIGTDDTNSMGGDGSVSSSYFRYDDGQTDVALVDEEDAIMRLSIMERKDFSSLLEEQISSAAIYYTSTLLPQVQSLVANNEYEKASTELLETISFAITNIITFRQLLVRYDAFCRTFDGMHLNEWHLQRSVLDVDHPVHGFFNLEGVDDLEKQIVIGMQKKEDSAVLSVSVDEFSAQVHSLVYLLEKTDTSLNKAVSGHVVFKDRLLALGMRLKQYMLFGIQSRKYFA